MAMPEIGSVVRAQVEGVEPYGIYLKDHDRTIVVLAPEVSWRDRRPLGKQVHAGEILDVLVLRYNYRDRVVVGSLRRLHPEQNPYRELSRLDPGEVLRGKVRQVIGRSVTIALPNGAWGELSEFSRVDRPLAAGDEVPVTITGLDVDEGRLWLDLVPQEPPAAPTSAPGAMAGIST